MDDSCIVLHFRHYSDLPDHDRRLLSSLEQSPERFSKNTTLWNEGDPSTSFFTVKTGWVYSFRHLEDGSRQIMDVFMSGDMVGLREIAFKNHLSGLITLTDSELCAFPKSRLNEVFSQSNLLCNVFFLVAVRDQAILLERLINLGRRSARQKLAHFLVEISARLERTSNGGRSSRRLPFSQSFLGDVLGLSSVHVSRTSRALREEGLIRRVGRHIELLDVERLKEIAGFDPTYLLQDLDSLPDPGSQPSSSMPPSAPPPR